MDLDPDPGLTIVLLGNTGVGKSASGNTILGCKAFKSGPFLKSCTKHISEATENVFGKQISVFDTPGILDCTEEIKAHCQSVLQSSRPVLFLVVLSIGRFTNEQEVALKESISVLGNAGLENGFLLFTNGDALKTMTLDDFIFQDEDCSLPDIVRKFTGKYHLFNNENEGQQQVRELLIKSGHLQTSGQGSHLRVASPGESVMLQETRIVLLGLPGGGKSASGNTILGSDQFQSDCSFDGVSTETVTKSADVAGRWVTVVDTPGFTSEVLTPQQLYMEIMKSIAKASPGPHAFVIVVKIGRMSGADTALLQMLQQLFGSNAPQYAMVLFTHGDELGGQSIEQKIQSSSCVSKLVSMCSDRYCVLDNKVRKSRRQVQKFMNKIEEIVTANSGKHFSSDMFRMAETFINEAERNQQGGTDETPRETAQRRLGPYLVRIWRNICETFTACCCRSITGSDDEREQLLERH